MPTTETEARRDYTAEETTAYEAYLSAVAEHNIVCARPGATTRDKMDAAFAAGQAFDRFCHVADLPLASRSLSDVRRIEVFQDALAKLIESSRSAWSMIRAADMMGVIERHAEGVDHNDHDACVCLIQDAEAVLRRAIEQADAV